MPRGMYPIVTWCSVVLILLLLVADVISQSGSLVQSSVSGKYTGWWSRVPQKKYTVFAVRSATWTHLLATWRFSRLISHLSVRIMISPGSSLYTPAISVADCIPLRFLCVSSPLHSPPGLTFLP